MTTKKSVQAVFSAPEPHWVGDGFPVRSIFSAHAYDPAAISPFLLLDYAGPHAFLPSDSGIPRGVDKHPHRGFETVTILYHGELEHRDSAGSSGRLGAGDVQWMTAAAGIVHEEKHSAEFTKRGGTLEMIQLWVNLPARDKNKPPRYQDIRSNTIPVADLPNDSGSMRVIAGKYHETLGSAETFTPIDVWDMTLKPGGSTSLEVPADRNTIMIVLGGEATVDDTKLNTHQGVLMSLGGEAISLSAAGNGATLLLLSGDPINEPVAAHGPFVMNTQEEIRQAIIDYQTGMMGTLS